jgi:hypothetical protein
MRYTEVAERRFDGRRGFQPTDPGVKNPRVAKRRPISIPQIPFVIINLVLVEESPKLTW